MGQRPRGFSRSPPIKPGARGGGSDHSPSLEINVPGRSPDDRVDVEAAVARLPRRQKLAVDCFYFIGLSVAETAAVMGCSGGTVKSTLSDARKRLRLLLEVNDG